MPTSAGRHPQDLVLSGIAPLAWSAPTDAPRYLPWVAGATGRPVAGPAPGAPALDRPRPAVPGPQAPFVRLAVPERTDAATVLRLLATPRVDAVVLPAVRPDGALRRRPWQWPLRCGLLSRTVDIEEVRSALAQLPGVPRGLVVLRDVAVDPSGVDVLVVPDGLPVAVALVRGTRQLANAVVVLGPRGAAEDEAALLAELRSATGAVVTALQAGGPDGGADVAPADASAVATLLHRLVRDMSHAHPFDVALTAALDRDVLMAGELDRLVDLDLPHLAGALVRGLRSSSARMRPPLAAAPPPEPVGAAADALDAVADRLDGLLEGAFEHESHEAADVGAALGEAGDRIAEAAVPRFVQCLLRPGDGSPSRSRRLDVLHRGATTVGVVVGPAQAGAVTGGGIDEEAWGFATPDVVAVRVTVVLVPLVPRGPAQRRELDVPRIGRSPEATFALAVPPGTATVSARVVVLHRNRVLQTAVLSGRPGERARLRELAVVWPDLTAVDNRRAFDLALVANHDESGTPALLASRDERTAVDVLPELAATAERMRAALVDASARPGRGGRLTAERTRRLLVDLAVDGNDLFGQLEGHLLPLGTVRRVQVVTARSGWFLPLELVYGRVAPDDDARMCPAWLATAGEDCGPSCGTGPDDTTIVCPMAFWGLSRTIERHYVQATEGGIGPQYLAASSPIAQRRRLSVARGLVAASSKVTEADVTATLAALDPAARRATSWSAWSSALAHAPTDLLVLMPHTSDATASMEVSGTTLRRGRIEARYVTGGHPTRPVVVLFGCDTAGTAQDPAGFASRFMSRQAATVFTTLTMLHSAHAPALARRLAAMLRDPARAEQPLGDVVTAFRRAALHDGIPAALAVASYGDADWTV